MATRKEKAETINVLAPENDTTKEQVALDSTQEVNQAAAEGQVAQASPTYTPVNGANTASSITEAEIKRDLDRAKALLSKEPLKTVNIPKQLAGILGETLPACINGVCIKVPVDGEDYEIPEPYVPIIKNSLKVINSGDVRAHLAAGANDSFLDDLK